MLAWFIFVLVLREIMSPMATSSTGLGPENDCAGEGQQEL
jgi:hypothetical protein